jgi:hypothetical protein
MSDHTGAKLLCPSLPEAKTLIADKGYDSVEFATLEWVDWFNNRRIMEPIGNIPPAEAEERYYAMQEQPAMAA